MAVLWNVMLLDYKAQVRLQ